VFKNRHDPKFALVKKMIELNKLHQIPAKMMPCIRKRDEALVTSHAERQHMLYLSK
jgi:hypothetical protein